MPEELLRALSIKNTRPRRLVLTVMEQTGTPLSAKQILARAQLVEPIDLSTVYRTLMLLTDKRVLQKSLHSDGQAYYELTGTRHRHHLICLRCNETIELENCPLHNLLQSLGSSTGYQIIGHNLEFFGICPACSQKQRQQH